MTYNEFKTEMQNLLNQGFKYTPEQVGFSTFADKMADLADEYPEYDAMLENESLNA